MPLSQHERNKRRALVVRRATARRIGEAQREIWRQRKAAQGDDFEEAGSDDALLADLPDTLLA